MTVIPAQLAQGIYRHKKGKVSKQFDKGKTYLVRDQNKKTRSRVAPMEGDTVRTEEGLVCHESAVTVAPGVDVDGRRFTLQKRDGGKMTTLQLYTFSMNAPCTSSFLLTLCR